jgi:hypothetical protein
MVDIEEKQVQILLGVNRQEALYRFLRLTFVPHITERGYSFVDLLQAIATWLYREAENKKAANHLLDAASEFD